MKLNELGLPRTQDQVAKVFERRLGDRINFANVDPAAAKRMLVKVRALIKEHRDSPSRHYSERNPDYLRLVMMEQALGAIVKAPAQTRSMRRKLKENEVQQAQVVMAAKDMVDQLQKMMEQVSEMQFKDLPALTDAIKNDIGVEQATQFQADATAALSQLLTAIQGGKQQLETAQGVVTGQAPVVPGQEAGAEMGAAPAEEPAAGGEEGMPDLSLDANMPEEEPGAEASEEVLGRERR